MRPGEINACHVLSMKAAGDKGKGPCTTRGLLSPLKDGWMEESSSQEERLPVSLATTCHWWWKESEFPQCSEWRTQWKADGNFISTLSSFYRRESWASEKSCDLSEVTNCCICRAAKGNSCAYMMDLYLEVGAKIPTLPFTLVHFIVYEILLFAWKNKYIKI